MGHGMATDREGTIVTQRQRDLKRGLHGSSFNTRAKHASVYVWGNVRGQQHTVHHPERLPSRGSACHFALNVIGSQLKDAYSIVIISLTTCRQDEAL